MVDIARSLFFPDRLAPRDPTAETPPVRAALIAASVLFLSLFLLAPLAAVFAQALSAVARGAAGPSGRDAH